MLQILITHPEEIVKDLLEPWQFSLLILAGWVNRQQQRVPSDREPSAQRKTREETNLAQR